ncbi:MAG: hypothetical protein JNL11_02555 [Bdellovibrionaceae bacterium]|nr:hypothetical protein [Pseudobdellovibrionaceae bacterium]
MNSIKSILIGLLSATLIQCSSSKKAEPAPPPTTPTLAARPEPVAINLDKNEEKKSAPSKELEDLKQSLKRAEAIVKKDAQNAHNTLAPTESASAETRKIGPTTADKALGWLKNGNTRYLKGFLRKDGANKKDVVRVSEGQRPHTIVFSCSDSRVPPELVFDQKLGEIFVVRTVGQTIDSSVLSSIEYGVQNLGVNLILVMGHSSCGAIKTAIETASEEDIGSPFLNALVAEVQPRIIHGTTRGPASEGLISEGWDNTRGVAQKLMEKSKIVRDAAKSGSLRVETALYHLKSGQVEWSH